MAAEITTGRAAEGGHWYGRDGSCVYEIRGANGKMRAVTLRDARKLGLVPGYSSVSRMEYLPGLERWKIEQAYLAALTLPRVDGESLEAFMERAKADAEAQATKARDRGSHLHAALQGYYEGQPLAAEDAPFVLPVVEWLNSRFPGVDWDCERSFAHPLGYGGKIDLSGEAAVVDFKFKDFAALPERSFAFPQHGMQLASYAHGIGRQNVAKINLFISSTVPGLIYPHEWLDTRDQWDAFLCLLGLWKIRNRYDSAFTMEAAA